MKRAIIIFLLMSMTLSMCYTSQAQESDMVDSFMEYLLTNTSINPITEIEIGEDVYKFSYDDGKRITMETNSMNRFFEYDGEVLVRQTDEIVMEFYFVDGEYTGFSLSGKDYFFVRNSLESVIALTNEEEELICKYEYADAIPRVIVCSENETDIKAANSNPFRYRGWYFDVESSLYYLDKGVFYNPYEHKYIQNEYGYNSRDGEPPIFQAVGSAYYAHMNNSAYGAGSYTFPSQAQWNNGTRWYDGVSQIELVSRCVYAENKASNRQNDRKAIGLVIRNRVAQNFYHYGPLSSYSIVCYPAAFATVNPTGSIAYMTDATTNSRPVMNKNEGAFQQATLIACLLYCSNTYSDYDLVIGIPSYVNSSHTHFLAVNYAYPSSTFSVSSGGQWNYGGSNIYEVCIAGVAQLTSKEGAGTQCLQTYYLNGYNVFFHY